jgi:hypothetical protein
VVRQSDERVGRVLADGNSKTREFSIENGLVMHKTLMPWQYHIDSPPLMHAS